MDGLTGTAIALATFCGMEVLTWLTHRFVMHGFLWYLHKDHHQKSHGVMEKNDWFSVIFAVPCIALFYFGTYTPHTWMFYVAVGILLYGLAYFFVHDIIIHQRIKWFTRSRNRYIRAMRWAHKMHHKHLNPENGESFGFLYVEKKYRKKIVADDLKQKSAHDRPL